MQYSLLYKLVKKTKAEVIELIKSLPLEKSLLQISYLLNLSNGVINKNGKNYFNIQKLLYLKNNIIKIENNLEYFNKCEMFCIQNLLLSYKWLIRYGEKKDMIDGYVHGYIDDRIIDIILMMSDFLPQEEVADCKEEFVWSNLYLNTQAIPKYEIARSYFILLKSRLYEDKYRKTFLNVFNMTLEEYLSILFSFIDCTIIDSTNTHFPMFHEINFELGNLMNKYKEFSKFFSIDIDSLKQLLIDDVDDSWDFSILFENPLIKFCNCIMPICSTVLFKSFFEYLFWKIGFIGENYAADNDTIHKFIPRYCTDFGKPYEKYIYLLTKSLEEKISVEVIEEFELEKKNTYSSDVYLRFDDLLIIVECKAKSPKDITNFMVKDSYQDAVIELLIDPVCQADRCYQKILEQKNDYYKFKEMDKVIKYIYVICVSMEKIQPIRSIYENANKQFNDVNLTYKQKSKKKEHKTKIQTEKIIGYINLNTYDYEKFCIILENKGKDEAQRILDIIINEHEPFDNVINRENYANLTSVFIENNLKSFTDECFSLNFRK